MSKQHHEMKKQACVRADYFCSLTDDDLNISVQ